MPKNSNYIANGIIVHNSGACIDCRSEDELDKKVFVIDLDGSATPIKEAFFADDDNVIVVDPFELDSEGEIDWVATYERTVEICKYLRRHEAELNLKAVVLDGLDTLLKDCEIRMRIHDLKMKKDSLQKIDTFDWQYRNAAYLLVVRLIKGMKCHRFYTTHMKELKGWVPAPGGGKTLGVLGEKPNWESSTPNLMFQKLFLEKSENKKILTWTATVEKCKGHSELEGKKYTVMKVDRDKEEVEWFGIKEFLKDCGGA